MARAAENVDWDEVDEYVCNDDASEGQTPQEASDPLECTTGPKHKKISVFFESFVIDRNTALAVNELNSEITLIKD